MFRIAVFDLPRFASVGFAAATLAIIGFVVSALMPTFIYAFPALRPSKPRARRTRKVQQRVAPTRSRPKLSVARFNAKFEATPSSSLVRPRQLLASRCRSIPANWDLSRGTCGEVSRRLTIPSRPNLTKRNSSFKDKLRPHIEGSPAAVLKAARETILRIPRPNRPAPRRAPSSRSSMAKADVIAEELTERSRPSLERTTSERSNKLDTRMKSISAANISETTTKFIKSCKLDVPVKVMTRESRKIIGAVADAFPPSQGPGENKKYACAEGTTQKKRPTFRRNKTEMEAIAKRPTITPTES